MSLEVFYERVRKQYDDKLPFAAYRKPNSDEVKAILQAETKSKEPIDYEESGFVFAPFELQAKSVLIQGEAISYRQDYKDSPDIRPVRYFPVSAGEKQRYLALVNKAIQTIQETELQKVVLSRKQTIDNPESDPFSLFQRMLYHYQDAFVYIVNHPETGLWLGATPETLISLKGNRFETMALAGTKPYTETSEISWGQKEKEEQQLVTLEITQRLEEFELKDLKIYPLESHRAGNLLHLRTRITGSLEQQNPNVRELLESLHPTAAICGYPRDLAKKFINECEGYNRNFYTGYLGELNTFFARPRSRNRRNVENLAYQSVNRISDIYVNLRCMQWSDNKAHIYVGGGITAASDAEAEWEETVNKAQTIARML